MFGRSTNERSSCSIVGGVAIGQSMEPRGRGVVVFPVGCIVIRRDIGEFSSHGVLTLGGIAAGRDSIESPDVFES